MTSTLDAATPTDCTESFCCGTEVVDSRQQAERATSKEGEDDAPAAEAAAEKAPSPSSSAISADEKKPQSQREEPITLLNVHEEKAQTPSGRGVSRVPCRYFFGTGHCLRGDDCPFSHGPRTLQTQQSLATLPPHPQLQYAMNGAMGMLQGGMAPPPFFPFPFPFPAAGRAPFPFFAPPFPPLLRPQQVLAASPLFSQDPESESGSDFEADAGAEEEEENSQRRLVPVRVVSEELELAPQQGACVFNLPPGQSPAFLDPIFIGSSGRRPRWAPKNAMWRTKPCSFFYHLGRCRKGAHCNFSHDFRNLVEPPPSPPPPRCFPRPRHQELDDEERDDS